MFSFCGSFGGSVFVVVVFVGVGGLVVIVRLSDAAIFAVLVISLFATSGDFDPAAQFELEFVFLVLEFGLLAQFELCFVVVGLFLGAPKPRIPQLHFFVVGGVGRALLLISVISGAGVLSALFDAASAIDNELGFPPAPSLAFCLFSSLVKLSFLTFLLSLTCFSLSLCPKPPT